MRIDSATRTAVAILLLWCVGAAAGTGWIQMPHVLSVLLQGFGQ